MSTTKRRPLKSMLASRSPQPLWWHRRGVQHSWRLEQARRQAQADHRSRARCMGRRIQFQRRHPPPTATRFTVIAPANPLRGLASDASYLSSILATISGPIVLVGHSYGGMVITNAATGNTNIKALVYIAAFAPDAGESLGSLGAMNPGSELGPTTLLFRPHPSGLDVYIAPEAFREVFAADVKARTAAVMAAGATSPRCVRPGRTVR